MTAPEFKFVHPIGITISGVLREQELLLACPEVAASKKDMPNGWAWYSLPPFTDRTAIVGMSLGFNGGMLEFVTSSDTHARFGAGWAEWSEANERLRASSIEAWLASKGYPVGNYSWGSVGAGYDSKGGFGSASIRYMAQPGVEADRP